MKAYGSLMVLVLMSASGRLTRVPIISLEYRATAAGDMARASSGRRLGSSGHDVVWVRLELKDVDMCVSIRLVWIVN